MQFQHLVSSFSKLYHKRKLLLMNAIKSPASFCKSFKQLGYNVKGIHTFEDPIAAVNSAQCVYIGGGNTFVLLKKLHDLNLVEPLRKRVLEDGMAFMGSSAGTNIATVSIATTNDMPIVYPPT